MRTINDEHYRKIIERRDPRYDGRFYFGVKTTRIYCRPICPARPKPENILIFKSATEAENAGYRPCLRCRPDLAPGSQRREGTGVSVARALRLIEEWPDESMTVESLAETLGMTDRHLRRLFTEHLGASPIEIMVNRRLHLARQLIVETQLPLTEIAFAAGFQSIRRFNEAFKDLYHRPPSDFRKKAIDTPDGLELSLFVRAPYDWESLLGFLRRHQTYGLERVDAQTYRRFLGANSSLEVRFDADASALRVKFHGVRLTGLRPLMARLRHLFDVDHNPSDLPAESGFQAAGIRIPGAFDPFETAVAIILGQLVSIPHAQQVMMRLVTAHGHRWAEEEIFQFPAPDVLKEAPLEELGMTRQKAGAIRELARRVHGGELSLTRTVDMAQVRAQLRTISGVGPWTEELIAMRCLGDADAFPKKDLAIQKALASGMLEEPLWISLRSYLTQILWREYAQSRKGLPS